MVRSALDDPNPSCMAACQLLASALVTGRGKHPQVDMVVRHCLAQVTQAGCEIYAALRVSGLVLVVEVTGLCHPKARTVQQTVMLSGCCTCQPLLPRHLQVAHLDRPPAQALRGLPRQRTPKDVLKQVGAHSQDLSVPCAGLGGPAC